MDIYHDVEAKRFVTTLDGHTAYLSYEVVDDTTLNYNHTIVPQALGGRGVGTALVKHALDYAKSAHKTVIPSCSFVAHYLQKHGQ